MRMSETDLSADAWCVLCGDRLDGARELDTGVCDACDAAYDLGYESPEPRTLEQKLRELIKRRGGRGWTCDREGTIRADQQRRDTEELRELLDEHTDCGSNAEADDGN
jgi:hypothetical protein